MFTHSYSKLSRTCYGESTPYALQKSSVLRRLQKHDDDDDEENSRTAAGREFQVRGTADSMVKSVAKARPHEKSVSTVDILMIHGL